MKSKIIIALIFLITVFNNSILFSQTTYFTGGSICNDDPWELVFEEEFLGTQLNTEIWSTFYDYPGLGIADYPNSRVHKHPGGDDISCGEDPSDDNYCSNEVYLDENVIVRYFKISSEERKY